MQTKFLVNGIIDGMLEAYENYHEMTFGDHILDAGIESYMSATIANKLWSNIKATQNPDENDPSLCVSMEQELKFLEAKVHGNSAENSRVSGRADVVVWKWLGSLDEGEFHMFSIIEVKRFSMFSHHKKDLDRINNLIMAQNNEIDTCYICGIRSVTEKSQEHTENFDAEFEKTYGRFLSSRAFVRQQEFEKARLRGDHETTGIRAVVHQICRKRA